MRRKHAVPPDLRSLLSIAVPAGPRFPDWRSPESVREYLEWPIEGIAFDVEHNNFWLQAWGPRPAALAEALSVARAEIRRAPRLLPVFGHRYLPEEPDEPGNPIFSVYQTDIIYYGVNLSNYLMLEFGSIPSGQAFQGSPRHIRFWSDLVE